MADQVPASASAAPSRLRVVVRGAVQGVGFRPFVWRLADELRLSGWVTNTPTGVLIEVEGDPASLASFLERLVKEKPPRAVLHGLEHAVLDRAGYVSFEIRESQLRGAATTILLPDIATCADCRREILDPRDRRHRYPFTNCTNCGPRYSIIESLPYDRARTTMKGFAMCARCRAEYDDPRDRRFHAQPVACPECGPRLQMLDAEGRARSTGDAALREAAAAVRDGLVVAVKSVGGFHLVADARNETAVQRLRARKDREEKPFALLYPSLDAVRAHARVSPLEETLLSSPEAPIVLLRRREDAMAPHVAEGVAPGNPFLGIMLPSNPLQDLLMADLGFPVVATSGNRSEEPICSDNAEALRLLAGIADAFLVHDRPIARPVDDSIARVIADRAVVLRRARGWAPLAVPLGASVGPAVAVGAHMKGAVAIALGDTAIVSEYLGTLDSERTCARFERTLRDLAGMYSLEPARVACDAHPDYPSTRYAASIGPPAVRVQHHYAHVLGCMVDNEIRPPLLGVAWDGTGFGLDGTVWGGEFLRVHASGFDRVAHLRTFRLPGGDRAVVEPRRAAIGLLHEMFGEQIPEDLAPVRAFAPRELRVLHAMLRTPVNAPLTSSAGRLFDAVAAILDLRQRCSFEGQAAMEVEFALDGCETDDVYEPASEDWEPMIRGIIADLRSGIPTGLIAAKFHNTLAQAIVAVARRVGETQVALSGGCFQNRYLTERAVLRLREAGFRPYWHQRVPPNDGGIALGQLAALAFPGSATANP